MSAVISPVPLYRVLSCNLWDNGFFVERGMLTHGGIRHAVETDRHGNIVRVRRLDAQPVSPELVAKLKELSV